MNEGERSISLKILLDTNFLLIPAQFGIDIFQELDRIISRKFELLIFQGIIDELNELSQESIKRQKEVNISLELIKQCTFLDLSSQNITSTNVDDILFQLAIENGWVVATNDRELRKRLRAQQIPVILLRKKAHLTIEGDIPS